MISIYIEKTRRMRSSNDFYLMQIMEVPSLLEEGSAVGKRNILKQKQEHRNSGGSCCS